MAKKIFTSSMLNAASKAVARMIAHSPDFSKKVEKYESGIKRKVNIRESNPISYGSNAEFIALNSSLKNERIEIANAIKYYKSDSESWILTNGPSGVDK